MSNREIGRSLIISSNTVNKLLKEEVIRPERLEELYLLVKENRREGVSGREKLKLTLKNSTYKLLNGKNPLI